MDDDAKNKLKLVLAAVAVIVAIGLAVRSGVHSANPPLKVVGHLGGNMQGPATPATPNSPQQSGKAASDAN